jgi:hypothetical protein
MGKAPFPEKPAPEEIPAPEKTKLDVIVEKQLQEKGMVPTEELPRAAEPVAKGEVVDVEAIQRNVELQKKATPEEQAMAKNVRDGIESDLNDPNLSAAVGFGEQTGSLNAGLESSTPFLDAVRRSKVRPDKENSDIFSIVDSPFIKSQKGSTLARLTDEAHQAGLISERDPAQFLDGLNRDIARKRSGREVHPVPSLRSFPQFADLLKQGFTLDEITTGLERIVKDKGREFPRRGEKTFPLVRKALLEIIDEAKVSEQEAVRAEAGDASFEFGAEEIRQEVLALEDTKPPDKAIFSEESYNAALKRMGDPNTVRTSLDPQMLKDWVTVGGHLVEKGVKEFAAWSEEMVKQIGEQIRPYLKEIYDRSQYPTLSKVEKIFEPLEKPPLGEKLKDLPGKIKTEYRKLVTTEYAVLDKLESDIFGEYGGDQPKLQLSAKFEQVQGATGKAQADVIDFYRAVWKPTAKVRKEFNYYLFLKRTIAELTPRPKAQMELGVTPAAEGAPAQGDLLGVPVSAEGIHPVGDWTIEAAERGLAELKQKVGDKIFARLEEMGVVNNEMTDRLGLLPQVESGRMSPKWRADLMHQDRFYAAFDVQFYHGTEFADRGVSGRKISTRATYTKARTGVTEEKLQLGDVLEREMRDIYQGRLLVEKNLAMRELNKLANIDTEGLFVRRLKPGENAHPGYRAVDYFENGERIPLEVSIEVYKAVQGLNPAEMQLMGKVAAASKGLLQYGAVGANIPFQTVNIPLDMASLALASKMGVKFPVDVVRFPVDWLRAFWASATGNFGRGFHANADFMDYLRSGEYNSTLSRGFFPAQSNPFRSRFYEVIDAPPKFMSLFEDANKITGNIRGQRMLRTGEWDKRLAGWDNLTLEQQEMLSKEIVTEVRRYAGSPDFWRYGALGKQLRLAIPFLNPAIQGQAAFIARLSGATGGREAAAMWARLGVYVGLPVTLLLLNNLMDEEVRKDFEKISDEDRRMYFFIPRDEFEIDEKGQKHRKWWSIPKKNQIQLFANLIENGIEWMWKNDPDAMGHFFATLFEDFSPVNVEGDTPQERAQSFASSTNPVFKVPAEMMTETNFFTHQPIVPDRIKGQDSRNLPPEEKYKESTEMIYRQLAKDLGVAPLNLKHIVEGFTGGGTRQLNVGEEGLLSGIFRRYHKQPYEKPGPAEDALIPYLNEQAQEYLDIARQAEDEWEKIGQMDGNEAVAYVDSLRADNEPLYLRIRKISDDEDRGLTRPDRLMLNLDVENGARAFYIADQLKTMPEESALVYIDDLRKKRILSKKVMKQLEQIIDAETVAR